MENKNEEQHISVSIKEDKPLMPNNYMGLSILSIILGFCSIYCVGFILGIIAVIFSSKVKSHYSSGNYNAAKSASKNAKLFSIISISIFVLSILISIYMYKTGMLDEVIQNYKRAIEEARNK